MAEKKERAKERDKDAPDLEPSDADAPGPITPEHESGSWEQTLEEQKAKEKAEPESKPASKSSGSSKSSS